MRLSTRRVEAEGMSPAAAEGCPPQVRVGAGLALIITGREEENRKRGVCLHVAHLDPGHPHGGHILLHKIMSSAGSPWCFLFCGSAASFLP